MARASLKVNPETKEELIDGSTETLASQETTTDTTAGDTGTTIEAPPVVEPLPLIPPGTPVSEAVKEVFGKFAVPIGGKISLFETRSEAATAYVLESHSTSYETRAQSYLAARELDPNAKMSKGRANVIKDFLAYEASL